MRRFLPVLLLLACNGAEYVSAAEARERLRAEGRITNAQLADGAVTYLGYLANPALPSVGDSVEITHYWQVVKPLARDYDIFVHVLAEGARGHVDHGDHTPETPTTAWEAGSVIATRHTLRLPVDLPAEAISLRVGLYRGKERLPVEAPHNDGTDRIRTPPLAVRGGSSIPTPRYDVPFTKEAPTLDGHANEPAWQAAPLASGFYRSSGTAPARHPVRAKLLHDATYLYAYLETDDPDIQATLQGRDAPVYKEEALELFLDPDNDQDRYVELQVSPLGTLFDAQFKGGPRQNMQTRWNAEYDVAVRVDGTVNDPKDRDRLWASEWRIKKDSLGETGAACWRANLFHIGKERAPDGQKGPADESAWSPPLMGDFHNLERFGLLCFDGPTP